MSTEAPKKHAFRAEDVSEISGTGYPSPLDRIAEGRTKRKVSDHAGLSDYGINITTLPPGAWSSQRHWHEQEDEFTYVMSGELVLVTDDGEETVTAGHMMGFPKGVENAHHLVNRSDKDAVYMEIGTRCMTEICHYPDVDLHMIMENDEDVFYRKDGTRYDQD